MLALGRATLAGSLVSRSAKAYSSVAFMGAVRSSNATPSSAALRTAAAGGAKTAAGPSRRGCLALGWAAGSRGYSTEHEAWLFAKQRLLPTKEDAAAVGGKLDFIPVQDREIGRKVNAKINGNVGRLFAIVSFAGKQYKVTPGDTIVVTPQTWSGIELGDKIRLEKILAAAGRDFSLIGRPLVDRRQVRVLATLIEDARMPRQWVFRFKRKKHYKKRRGYRTGYLIFRINEVSVHPAVGRDDVAEADFESDDWTLFAKPKKALKWPRAPVSAIMEEDAEDRKQAAEAAAVIARTIAVETS